MKPFVEIVVKKFQDVKGDKSMVNCPNCDMEIGENIKFCTTCGTKIEEPIPDISQENNFEILCPNCSAHLPANTRFCIDCGTKIENLNAPHQEIICPKCSVENPAGTKFCTSCGTKLEHIVNSSNQDIICPKCSSQLPAGTRFCTDCGTKFNQISHSDSTVMPNDLISVDTVETVKETGKDIMKGVGGLFNKASSKGGLFDKVSASIDDVVSPKTKTIYKRMLICQNCGNYYELEKGESPNDFSDECECGGKLKYQLRQEKIQI